MSMRFPVVSPFKHLVLVGIVTVAAFAALTGTASATYVTSTTTAVGCGGVSSSPAGNGALTLHYCGHNYICYYHDLCLYRGGRFEAYFKCQTVNPQTATALGWSWNNQSSTGTATFFTRSGWSPYPKFLQTAQKAYGINWRGVSSFRTCP